MARSSAPKAARKQVSAPRDRVAFPPRQDLPRAQQDRRLEARVHEARHQQRDRRHEASEPLEDEPPPQDPDIQMQVPDDHDPEWDSDAPDEDDDEWPCRPVETTFDKRKRRKKLVPALASNDGRKKDDEELHDIKDDARFLYRALGPFINISMILSQGITYMNRHRDWTAFEDYFDDMDDNEVNEAVTVFDELLKALPSVARDIRWYAKKPSVVSDLAEFLQEHAAAGRVDDTSKLRYNVLLWVPEMPGYDVLPPDIDKGLRGFHSTTTARYLCPMNMIDTFDEDPEG
ncbi:hypothetical protein EIP86_004941 [Pleurotus ostreatoroseus]|nr:hypothetical protein EIP86_004941 [Pleurotus ostreatoroseus]